MRIDGRARLLPLSRACPLGRRLPPSCANSVNGPLRLLADLHRQPVSVVFVPPLATARRAGASGGREGGRWVHVADRGTDTFEALERFPHLGRFVVRANTSRGCAGSHDPALPVDTHLHDYARALPSL